MPAPKGNKYALGNDGGRPTKLTPELLEKAGTFLERVSGQRLVKTVFTKSGPQQVEVEVPPTLVKLAIDLDVNRETLREWAKTSQEFSAIFSRVKENYERVLIENGLTDNYNAGLARFLLSADHDKREKSDVTTDGRELPTPILNVVKDALPSHGSDKEGPGTA